MDTMTVSDRIMADAQTWCQPAFGWRVEADPTPGVARCYHPQWTTLASLRAHVWEQGWNTAPILEDGQVVGLRFGYADTLDQEEWFYRDPDGVAHVSVGAIPQIVVTRHAGLVAYLQEQGIIGPDAEIVTHVESPAQVAGKHVVGVLPLLLAAYAARVTEVGMTLPRELYGQDLALDQIRPYITGVATYQVAAIDPSNARPFPARVSVITAPTPAGRTWLLTQYQASYPQARADVTVLDRLTPAETAGQGVLTLQAIPLALAATATCVTVPLLHLAADQRGRPLTEDEITAAYGGRFYAVSVTTI